MRTVGYSGVVNTQFYTQPLVTKIGGQTLEHQYLYAPNCPVNLMGRDLLTKLNAKISCSEQGMIFQIRDKDELLPNIMFSAPTPIPVNNDSTLVYWPRLTSPEIDTPHIQ